MTAISIKGTTWKIETAGQIAEYEMGNAPKHVQHAIRLLTTKWGTSFDDSIAVQKFACHRARLLAEKWGVPHP